MFEPPKRKAKDTRNPTKAQPWSRQSSAPRSRDCEAFRGRLQQTQRGLIGLRLAEMRMSWMDVSNFATKYTTQFLSGPLKVHDMPLRVGWNDPRKTLHPIWCPLKFCSGSFPNSEGHPLPIAPGCLRLSGRKGWAEGRRFGRDGWLSIGQEEDVEGSLNDPFGWRAPSPAAMSQMHRGTPLACRCAKSKAKGFSVHHENSHTAGQQCPKSSTYAHERSCL